MKKNPDKLIIPLLENDTLKDIIRAFLFVLHEDNYIYISNSTEGDIYTTEIFLILKDLIVNSPQEIAKKLLEKIEYEWKDNE